MDELQQIIEGILVADNRLISMGVHIGRSTKIDDRVAGEVIYGRIPEGSVAVAGMLPSAGWQGQPVRCRHRHAGGYPDAGQDRNQ